jgi:hypothetical protein
MFTEGAALKVAQTEYPTAKELTEALDGDSDGHGRWDAAKRQGRACCPAHSDETPSLDIKVKGGKVLFTCRAGCDQGAVLDALRRRGLWPERHERPAKAKPGRAKIVATYSYELEDGTEHFQVCRFEPKEFRQRHRGPDGKWAWKAPDTHRFLPYRLPDISEAIAHERVVFLVEGEKDVDALARHGIAATCNAGGGGKWRPDHSGHLKGADVVIIPDNDDTGRHHVNEVCKSLRNFAARVRVLELPGLPEKGDVSDWLDAGGAIADLRRLADDAPDVTNVIPFPAKEAAPAQRQPAMRPGGGGCGAVARAGGRRQVARCDCGGGQALHGATGACCGCDRRVGTARLGNPDLRHLAVPALVVAHQAMRQDHAADDPALPDAALCARQQHQRLRRVPVH